MVNVKNRDRSLDIFKGFAILIVVVGHALQALLPIEGGYSLLVIRSFQMELFMFTSGMAFSYTYPEKANGCSMKKLVVKLLPVYLIWGYVLFFLTVWASGSELNLFRTVSVLYNSGFWYLRYLLLYEIFILCLGVTLRHISVLAEKKVLYYILPLLGISVIWMGTHVPILKESISSPLYIYLVLGLYFGKIKDKIGEKPRIVITGIGVVGMIALIALHRFAMLIPPFAIMAFWGLATQTVKLPKPASIFSYIGLRTLQIYAIHVCVLHGPWIETGWYRLIYEKSGMPSILAVVLLSVLWIAICLLAEWIISKNKRVSCILFGR